jgi:addiction module HigA family antidote
VAKWQCGGFKADASSTKMNVVHRILTYNTVKEKNVHKFVNYKIKLYLCRNDEVMVHIEGIDDRMIANNLEPHYLTHPGEVIKDELEARGISQRQLARSIGVPASQLNELLNAKRSLSAEMALLIGQALGLDPAPLLALQTDYNLLLAKRNKTFLERLKDIPRIAAVF